MFRGHSPQRLTAVRSRERVCTGQRLAPVHRESRRTRALNGLPLLTDCAGYVLLSGFLLALGLREVNGPVEANGLAEARGRRMTLMGEVLS